MPTKKTMRCKVCHTQGITIPEKIGYLYGNGSERAICVNCNSQYKLKYLWSFFSGPLDDWQTDLAQYALISFGLAAIPLGIYFLFIYMLRFVFTFNRPYKLIERNSDFPPTKQEKDRK